MKKKIFFLFLFIGLISGTVPFVKYNLNPVSSDTTIKNFVVNQGEGLSSIALRLQKNGLIRNRYIFMLYAYQLGLDSKLQSGLFRLSPSLGVYDLIKKLSSSGSHDYWLKIIGGQRIEEITPRFDSLLEGYLFPDSYLIPEDYVPSQIYEVIKENFDKKFSQAKVDASNTGLSDADIVILASLIEREARTLKSKQSVAGILLNRLKINMALQLDATVQYARDSRRLNLSDYWRPVTKSDLSIDSPYNTYKYPGLPPAPICNPGYDSLYAAFHPIKSDYFYYITGLDNQMHYARTLDEHNANIAKYLR